MTNDQADMVDGVMSCLAIGHSDLELYAGVWITAVRCGVRDRLTKHRADLAFRVDLEEWLSKLNRLFVLHEHGNNAA